MKRIIFATILAIISSTVAMADTPPQQQSSQQPAILAVFNEKTYRNPNVDATIIDNNENSSYKKIEVRNDAKLIAEIKRLFDIDRKRTGANIVERYSGGQHKYIVSFSNISMSLEETGPDSVTVWISM